MHNYSSLLFVYVSVLTAALFKEIFSLSVYSFQSILQLMSATVTLFCDEHIASVRT